MTKWSDIRALQFLEIYERHECLWNPRIEEYKNKTARNAAFESILAELQIPGLTANDIKLKIKNIRTTYKRELSTVLKAEASRAKGSPEYKPKLFWFHRADSFLRPSSRFPKLRPSVEGKPDIYESHSLHIPPNEVNCASSDNHNKYKQETLHEMTMALEETDTEEMNNVSEEHNVETLQETTSRHQQKHESQQQQQDISVGETIIEETITIAPYRHGETDEAGTNIQENDSTTVQRGTHEEDEYTMFCRSIEAQLRALPDSYSRSLAKFKIQQVLFKVETGQYRKAAYVTIPSTHS